MMRRRSGGARALAGLLALLLGLVISASPCLAGETPSRPAPLPAAPLRTAVAARLATLNAPPAAALAQAAPPAPTGESKPFFKSTKGVLVLVLLAGGFTWAAVSRSQDAVHSPGRK